MQDKVQRHPARCRHVAGFCQVGSHLFNVCHASQGYKWPVSRNWVSLPVETPMGEGPLLWADDSGTPREQLVICFSLPNGLAILPSQSHLDV